MIDQPSLHDQIVGLIQTNGPISLSDYMGLALMHPTAGYYNRKSVFGTKGDFITAPEISQMFGEILGLALLERWQHAGRPDPVRLIELGPGRGTLMADMVRAMGTDPAFRPTIHFVEAAHARETEQRSKGLKASHHESLSEVPAGYSLVMANEFFDALPIRQFQYDKGHWRERLVGLNEDDLAIGLGPTGPLPSAALLPAVQPPRHNDVLEVLEAAQVQAKLLGDRLETEGGIALIIDYGYDGVKFGSTFQAVKSHQMVDPFREAGQADLTAHVCFSQLKYALGEMVCFGPVGQGEYLMTLGIGQRALQLSKAAGPEHQFDLLNALKRLTAPEEMGDLFKVMMVSSSPDTPPGFN